MSGICFFKGLRLLFFPNVPGATFIQGATLIPESRVHRDDQKYHDYLIGTKDTFECLN